jgi:flagellar basal body-associated protein FliL
MKVIIAIIVTAFLVFLGIQIYSFMKRGEAAEKQYQNISTQVEKARRDYHSIEAELEYYMKPANLEKELRARFNYRGPDEKLIIIVPPMSGASTSSGQ